ncbi:YsnF/AvaK domain-containing protein [Aquabacterium sp. A7-Y]|uniref:YsnF/AvaK domain-containing protein n=1 Tax=Aquabacterium sp. A7-Y TaxID=1349605 RepID=UPI00223D6315|nr:YsnF/AvaK domain-containing protein [Aquabacterium sp. A7-Y]MCW7540829.1 YsnF/AvaK domain-containing protein [Aquabacterium sp. A7-Y]
MTSPSLPTALAVETGLQATVPVVEEIPVLTRSVEQTGAVRVRIVTEAETRRLDTPELHEDVVVERVPVGRPCEERRAPWQDGDVWVVPVYEEQVVVERRWILKEEVRLHRRQRSTPGTREVVLRREQAVVERQQPDGSWQAVD